MAQGTIALLMLLAGSGLLVSVGRIGNTTAKAIAVRLAAIAFVGTGLNVAGGWIGTGIGWVVEWVDRIGSAVLSEAFGTTATWLLYLAFVVVWVAGMVPEKWFSFQIPDWLSISGVLLPAMTAGLPGDFGQGLHEGVVTAGQTMTDLMVGAVS